MVKKKIKIFKIKEKELSMLNEVIKNSQIVLSPTISKWNYYPIREISLCVCMCVCVGGAGYIGSILMTILQINGLTDNTFV